MLEGEVRDLENKLEAAELEKLSAYEVQSQLNARVSLSTVFVHSMSSSDLFPSALAHLQHKLTTTCVLFRFVTGGRATDDGDHVMFCGRSLLDNN